MIFPLALLVNGLCRASSCGFMRDEVRHKAWPTSFGFTRRGQGGKWSSGAATAQAGFICRAVPRCGTNLYRTVDESGLARTVFRSAFCRQLNVNNEVL
ncbi:MAG: hypothetical protein ABL911_08385 [Gallionella sp.]